jgi:hypothetical protein
MPFHQHPKAAMKERRIIRRILRPSTKNHRCSFADFQCVKAHYYSGDFMGQDLNAGGHFNDEK